MTCNVLSNGRVLAVACTRGGDDRRRCKWCGGPIAKLCDYPVKRDGKEGTCDAPMCARCATSIAPDVDYCPPHARHHRRTQR